jgi:hypothetical protein
VVCSHAASLPEVVGDAAILVDPSDVAQIAGAHAPGAHAAGAGRCPARKRPGPRARFTWERTARETMAVYERVAAGER